MSYEKRTPEEYAELFAKDLHMPVEEVKKLATYKAVVNDLCEESHTVTEYMRDKGLDISKKI